MLWLSMSEARHNSQSLQGRVTGIKVGLQGPRAAPGQSLCIHALTGSLLCSKIYILFSAAGFVSA